MNNTTRRDFLKVAIGGSALLGLSPVARLLAQTMPATRGASAAGRPNIIVILADDMGYSDIGCYGSEIQTPNLDRLAAGGMRFTQMYNAARCCPSRASLLTGLYPHQAGIGSMVTDEHLPGYRGHLNDECVTLAEVLRAAGYSTLMVGKWHVGSDKGQQPGDRGFDKYFSYLGGASSYFNTPVVSNSSDAFYRPQPGDAGYYTTDAFSAHAAALADEALAGDKPFFMYLAHKAPHWPVHALSEDVAKYKNMYADGPRELAKRRHKKQLDMGLVNPNWPYDPDKLVPEASNHIPMVQTEKDSKPRKAAGAQEAMQMYAAQVDRMDQGIGKLLDVLRARGAMDNTLILFMSDNGGCHEGNGYGQPWATASNTPFRRHKHWVHEGGISTPLVAHWPARIAKGKVVHDVAHITDIMPTLVEVAGATYPAQNNGKAILPMEGRSLTPILDGKTRTPPELLCWEHQGNKAVREGKWKLVAAGQPWELYDVEADRTENVNLIDKEPDKVKRLTGLYMDWAKRCNVLRPEGGNKGKKANASEGD
jgi:arylsulfatase